MKLKLSICIPTYNRANYLDICLQNLVPQLVDKENTELIIIDNASPDHTELVVKKYLNIYKYSKYEKNSFNLGYVRNQIKCIELSKGEYTAILCDDDVYTDNLVNDILEIINKNEYSFIALNYYSFIYDFNKPYKKNYAPTEDKIFKRAYDIMNYPSVGHFSGFIFNSNIAKKTLKQILTKTPVQEYEKYRGIITDIAHRGLSNTSIPSYFYGQRKLANRIPFEVDYDSIKHICIENYEYYHALFQEGVIDRKDLNYRKRLVLSSLPRAIIVDSYKTNKYELQALKRRLLIYFNNDMKFLLISLPLLYLARFILVKQIYKAVHTVRRKIKYAEK